MTDATASERAFECANASSAMGPVDWVFTCAGAAIPGLFCDQATEDFEKGITLNYFGTLYSIKVPFVISYQSTGSCERLEGCQCLRNAQKACHDQLDSWIDRPHWIFAICPDKICHQRYH